MSLPPSPCVCVRGRHKLQAPRRDNGNFTKANHISGEAVTAGNFSSVAQSKRKASSTMDAANGTLPQQTDAGREFDSCAVINKKLSGRQVVDGNALPHRCEIADDEAADAQADHAAASST